MDKIQYGIQINTSKIGGYGIGLSQIKETIQDNFGSLYISSEGCKGTVIKITFPSVKIPYWITREINISSESVIIILDGRSSTHLAWDIRLLDIIRVLPAVHILHFKQCNKVIAFINSLSVAEKSTCCC